MDTKAIKISKKNYEWLCELAGKMQTEEKRNISIDEALTRLRSSKKLSDLAGMWNINDKEARKLLSNIRKRWGNWKARYA